MALKVGLRFRGAEFPAAYLRVLRVSGGKQDGWNGSVGLYADKAARDGGEAPITEIQVYVPGVTLTPATSPGMVNQPEPLDALPAVAPIPAAEFNFAPFNALYSKLRQTYPDAVAC
jgi:hypothetical protein